MSAERLLWALADETGPKGKSNQELDDEDDTKDVARARKVFEAIRPGDVAELNRMRGTTNLVDT